MEESSAQPHVKGFTHVHALSSTGVEALAVLQVLRWAKATDIREVIILTDSLEVVRALSDISCANVSFRNVILDVLDIISSFDYVSITKATRQDVKNAHNLARSRICNHT